MTISCSETLLLGILAPFLPRDARAERGYEIACRLSVCL